MSTLKKEYDELTKKIEKIIEEIKPLEESETVKKYLKLVEESEELCGRKRKLYEDMKVEEYNSCEHVLVYSKVNYDGFEGRTYRSRGCIKCGLNTSVLDIDREYLSTYGEIMYDYLKKEYISGIETKISCDLDLAQAIYSKIKKAHPNIDDKTAIKYFEIALGNIRNIKVSDDRKISRAKRLSLSPYFYKWKQ